MLSERKKITKLLTGAYVYQSIQFQVTTQSKNRLRERRHKKGGADLPSRTEQLRPSISVASNYGGEVNQMQTE